MRQKLFILLILLLQPTLSIATDKTDTETTIELYNSQDYRAAFTAFEQLAENENDPVAQYYLANMYAGGQGIESNKEMAFQMFYRSAISGHAKAQFKTGLAYNEGFGVKKDLSEAVRWFEQAAEQEVPEAQFYLAVAYQQGEVVQKDPIKAAKWMKAAAKQGIPEAQTNLGNFYAKGLGLRQDNVLAFAWFSIAALSGNEQTEISQQMLVTKMTQEELKEGEDLAKKIYRRMYKQE